MIRLKRAKIEIRKVLKIYRRLYGGRQTSVKFRDFEEHISSLVFNKSLSSLAVLLILRRFFQWCRQIFPYFSISKVEKTVEESVTSRMILLIVRRWY